MLDLIDLGSEIAKHRRNLKLTQTELAQRASVSRATVDALENGRTGELGFSKVLRLLNAVGLELKLQPASNHRPTLDELIEENRQEQDLERRRLAKRAR